MTASQYPVVYESYADFFSNYTVRVTEAPAALVSVRPPEPFCPKREARKQRSATLVAAIAVVCAAIGIVGAVTIVGKVAIAAVAAAVVVALFKVKRGELRTKPAPSPLQSLIPPPA